MSDEIENDKVEPRIVAATGTSANANVSGDWATAEKQEAAMAEAVMAAHHEGITDPDEIRSRILAARDSITNGGPK